MRVRLLAEPRLNLIGGEIVSVKSLSIRILLETVVSRPTLRW